LRGEGKGEGEERMTPSSAHRGLAKANRKGSEKVPRIPGRISPFTSHKSLSLNVFAKL